MKQTIENINNAMTWYDVIAVGFLFSRIGYFTTTGEWEKIVTSVVISVVYFFIRRISWKK